MPKPFWRIKKGGETVEKHFFSVAGRDCVFYEGASPSYLLIQPVDEPDKAALDKEVQALVDAVDVPFSLLAFSVAVPYEELSPWDAPPVFGNTAFGHGAGETLAFIERELVPKAIEEYGLPQELPIILGGYSLAGLFALWTAWQTDAFSAIAAASPSVWFPHWLDYARQDRLKTKAVYLSLGDREWRTRNPVMATVKDCICSHYEYLKSLEGLEAALEWNKGNHFQHTDKRCAKAFAWCLTTLSKMGTGK